MVNLPTNATLPAFESSRHVPFQMHRVSRTFSGLGSATSYRVHKSVQIGRPQAGRPGCADRMGSAAERPESLFPTATSPTDPSHVYREGFAFQDRHDERRLTNSSSAIRPQTIHDPLASEASTSLDRKITPIELRGSPKFGTANQYRKLGGPSHHRANLESWRMPHTQAHSFEKVTYDRLVSGSSEEIRRMLPRPTELSSGRAVFGCNAVVPNYLKIMD